MPDEVVLAHPDLPDAEYTTNPRHASVLAESGWEPKPESKKKRPATPSTRSSAQAGNNVPQES